MLTDRELLRRVIDGEKTACDAFVVRFSRFVYAILHRNLRLGPDLADDLFQSVFVHLWDDDCRRMRQWRGEGDFADYLGPIVRHLALGYLRSPRHKKEESADGLDLDGLIGPEPTPEEEARVQEQRSRLEHNLA